MVVSIVLSYFAAKSKRKMYVSEWFQLGSWVHQDQQNRDGVPHHDER